MSDRKGSNLPTLGAFAAHEARNAVHDIRQKLFEEAWFGRVTTAAPIMEVSRDGDMDRSQRARLDELWGRAIEERGPAGAKERDEPPIDR